MKIVIDYLISLFKDFSKEQLKLSWFKTGGLLALLMGSRSKNDQQLTGVSQETIPETIARRISAPVPLLFLKWRMVSHRRL